MMRRWWRLLRLVAALGVVLTAYMDGHAALSQAGEPEGTPPYMATVTFLLAGGDTRTMTVEIASTPNVSTCGLGYRFSMPDEQGMLFVFQTDSSGPFWNRNTFIPLTLAWIGADGAIRQLTDMDPVPPDEVPQHNTIYTPAVSYRYVIEANQGWFDRNGVSVGDQVDLGDALARVPDLADRPTPCDERGY